MTTERSKDAAQKTIRRIRDHLIKQSDENLATLLSKELVDEIFEKSWRFQFEEERRESKRVVREIVRERIEEMEIGEES